MEALPQCNRKYAPGRKARSASLAASCCTVHATEVVALLLPNSQCTEYVIVESAMPWPKDRRRELLFAIDCNRCYFGLRTKHAAADQDRYPGTRPSRPSCNQSEPFTNFSAIGVLFRKLQRARYRPSNS
eukprot:79061-Pleurochrysis_carterae.AAC.1